MLTENEILTMKNIYIENEILSAVIKIIKLSNISYMYPLIDNKIIDEGTTNFQILSDVIYNITNERLIWLPISIIDNNTNNGWIIQNIDNNYYIYYYTGILKFQSEKFLGILGNNNLIPHLSLLNMNFKNSSLSAYKNYNYANHNHNLSQNLQSSIGFLYNLDAESIKLATNDKIYEDLNKLLGMDTKHGGTYYHKYLKYKNKYLGLRSKFIKQA